MFLLGGERWRLHSGAVVHPLTLVLKNRSFLVTLLLTCCPLIACHQLKYSFSGFCSFFYSSFCCAQIWKCHPWVRSVSTFTLIVFPSSDFDICGFYMFKFQLVLQWWRLFSAHLKEDFLTVSKGVVWTQKCNRLLWCLPTWGLARLREIWLFILIKYSDEP